MSKVSELFSALENDAAPLGQRALRDDRPWPATIIEARVFTGDLLLHALRQALPGLTVDRMGSIDDVPPSPPRTIVYSFVNRGCDLRDVEAALSRLRDRFAACRLVILTDASSPELDAVMLRHDIDRWVPASAGFDAVVAALTAVSDQAGTRRQRGVVVGDRPDAPDALRLTKKETLILRLLHVGMANKLIAFELQCSESTVKVHIGNMMRKLRLRNRTQLALFYGAPEARPPGRGTGPEGPDGRRHLA